MSTNERPPADDFIKEAIFDRKCGSKDKAAFYRWCMEGNGTISSVCKNIGGNQGDCLFDAVFDKNQQNSSSISYEYKCRFGASYEKWNNRSDKVILDKENLEKVMLFCEQELYGKPFVFPWWLILLIVLGVIIVLTFAFSLFWRLWLRDKLYKKQKSKLDNYTSAPFSNSNVESGRSRGDRTGFTTMNPSGRSGRSRRSRRHSGSGRSNRRSERSVLS